MRDESTLHHRLRALLARLALATMGLALLAGLNACGSGVDEIARKEQAEFHYKLANNYFFDHNIVMAMRECYEALERDPEHADAHHLLGFIFFGRKQYADATEHFKKAITSRPKHHEAIANLGAVYLAQKRWDDAIVQFELLTQEQLYPTPDLAHVNLGWAFYNKKEYGPSLEHYRLSLFLNPKLCLAHNNLGLLYETTGELDLAVDSFQRAIAECPKYVEPLFHLGRLLAQSGQHGPASEAFSRCYELNPDSPMGRRCAARRL